jgi:phosphotransferase family enzyme
VDTRPAVADPGWLTPFGASTRRAEPRRGENRAVDAEIAPADLDRIERALGWRPSRLRRTVADRGSSATAGRYVVTDGDRSAFVKLGATELTAEFFRREHRTYRALGGRFMPRLLGFADDGEVPVLALEDLSGATWPPPWTDELVASVIACLDEVHRTEPPEHLERMRPTPGFGWAAVARSPSRFLALTLCSSAWLTAALPQLLEAEARAPLEGHALVHLDVRSDNVCSRGGQALLVDWVEARIANPDLDVAFWLPSLAAEGGPQPETILPAAPELAAWVAGYFASRAGEPPIPEAPHVRPLQRMQARTALPWAARALGLPPPSSPGRG